MPRPNFTMPEPLPATPVALPERNTPGTVGLVLSILALLTFGLLSPVSLIVSLVGMSRPPRTRAGIGVLLSAFGCVLAITLGAVGMVAYTHYRKAEQELRALQALQLQQLQQPNGLAPAEAAGRLEDLVGKLESLTPEERDQLNGQLQEVVQSLDDVQREAQGLPPRPKTERITPPMTEADQFSKPTTTSGNGSSP